MPKLIATERIARAIFVLRGQRLPADFMMQLTAAEWNALRSQNVTLNPSRGAHRKYLPHAFTEQGVAMLSSVINRDSAIAVNIQIMCACVQLRGLLGSNKVLARRFAQLEARIDKKLSDYDDAIAAILSADWNVSTPDVFKAIYKAETRRGEQGVLDANQDMPRDAMLYAYTINAARAMRQEANVGSIEPGKAADFALVDRDVITVPAEQMRDTRVLWTMVAGKWVYRADGLAEPR